MNIPDKYRDRYDRLAASHPWMREMRDEPELIVYNEASDDELFRCSYCHCKVYNIDMTEGDCGWGFTFCPQCGGEVYESDSRKIEAKLGEPTNGIGGETNGIEDETTLSDGEAVDMLRKYVEECESANGKDGTRGKRLLQIADMVERDYVSRETHSKAYEIWQAASDEWCKRALNAEAERDEWKAKAKQAELRSNDRVTNLEWYYEHDSDFAWKVDNWAWDAGGFSTSQPLDEIPWTHPKMREWLMAPHVDAQRGSNGTCPNSDETCPNDVDSREKLEADACNHIAISITPNKENDGVLAPYATVLEWLDRQAAITERECRQREYAEGDVYRKVYTKSHIDEMIRDAKIEFELQRERNTELQAALDQQRAATANANDLWGRTRDELAAVKAERDNLADDLLASNREREHLRRTLGIALDHAHDVLALVNLDGEVVS